MLVSRWIKECNNTHIACRWQQSSPIEGFKLIDCTTRQIIPRSLNFPYVALSHVWGTTQPVEFVTTLPGKCRADIEDAIEVTLRLNYRYLWIDLFCIDQQNRLEKHHQILNMGSIYACTELTIISMGDDQAIDGFSRLRHVNQEDQPWAEAGPYSLLLSSLPDPADQIRNSKWMTRAWTYQEGLLSRRRLVFTKHQMYFQCLQHHETESLNGFVAFPPLFENIRGMTALKSKDFVSCVNNYASRKLSYESDALNAISGVLKIFEKMEPPIFHLYGVPIFHFQDYRSNRVLAEAEYGQSIAICLSWVLNTPAKRRVGFPSWSWLGWQGWTKMTFQTVDSAALGQPSLWSGVFTTHINVATELPDGALVHCGKRDMLNPVLFSQFLPHLHINGWETNLEFRNIDAAGWKLTEPKISESSHMRIEFTSLAEVSSDREVQSCQGVLLITSHGRGVVWSTTDTRITLLLVKRINDDYTRVGLCTFWVQGALHHIDDSTISVGEMEFHQVALRMV